MPRRRSTLLLLILTALVAGACSHGDGAAPDDAAPGAVSGESTTLHPPDDATTDTGAQDRSAADDAAAGSSLELHRAACAGELGVTTAGTLPDHLTSVSGLAASHRHPGVVWAVEDSFEPAEVTALDHSGEVLATVRLEGASPMMNIDWEALAVGPGPDGRPWVHVADIGDNLGLRTELRILRFPEPDLGDARITPEVVTVRHEHGHPNAEAMAVDADGIVWVIDKVPGGGTSTVLRLHDDGVLRAAGTIDLPGEEVTALDLARGGSVLALRTQRHLRLFTADEGHDVVTALAGDGCTTPELAERQGESVTFTGDGRGLLTVSEDESGEPVDLHLTGP